MSANAVANNSCGSHRPTARGQGDVVSRESDHRVPPLPKPRKLGVGYIERLRGWHAGPAGNGRRCGPGDAAWDLPAHDSPASRWLRRRAPLGGVGATRALRALLASVQQNKWNMTQAARQLSLSCNTLYSKLQRHGIQAGAWRLRGDWDSVCLPGARVSAGR